MVGWRGHQQHKWGERKREVPEHRQGWGPKCFEKREGTIEGQSNETDGKKTPDNKSAPARGRDALGLGEKERK